MSRFLAAIIFIFAALQNAWAAGGVSVSMISGGYGQSGRQVLHGLKVDLEPGWHAYWKSPGEAGLSPDVRIAGRNIRDGRAFWPIPERFDASGFETVGYTRSFVVPITAEVDNPSQPADLAVEGTLYACSDACVPVPVDLEVTTRPSGVDPSALRELAGWLARAPGGGRTEVTPISFERSSGGDIVVRWASRAAMTAPSAFLDMGMQAFGSLKSLDLAADGTATARFAVTNLRDLPPDLLSARAVLSDGTSSPIDVPIELSGGGFGAILLLALAGGLILNAMPCVFPVLAIKILMLASIDRDRIRPTLAAMALGVVTTFLLIGASLAAVKAAGHSVGWGMQFQQPVFLAVMALMLIVFGASMTGAFTILLPSSLATRLTAATDGDGAWKAFLQGAVLTLLATPCSAPFVGTAVGYGLSSASSEMLLVFAAMGLGMAMPFVVLAAFTRLVAYLPRPGRWMEHVKQATAVAMFAASGWLIYLLHAAGSTLLLGAVLAAVIAALVSSAIKSSKIMALMAISLMIAPTIFIVPGLMHRGDGVKWRRLDPAAISGLVSEGRTVFVDVSADWCITCKVNERGVLASRTVVDLLERTTVPMKGDWTRPDDEISAFLRSHGRYGIPFYLVAGPGAPGGIVLPELLTEDAISAALSQASGLPSNP